MPEGTHSLAPRPGSLARLTFQKWSAWQDSHLQPFRLERNASALGYTRWCPRSDLHRHFARFKRAVSALDYVGGRSGLMEYWIGGLMGTLPSRELASAFIQKSTHP